MHMLKHLKNRVFAPISIAAMAIGLTGCLPDGSSVSGSSGTELGLRLGVADSPQAAQALPDIVRLDVIVPVFDPNIPEDSDQYEKLGIWPEVRRTEASRFAGLMKQELQATKAFGDVLVTPGTSVTGELYVLGKILKSNGEDVKFEISVYDISQRRLMQKTYEHRVKEYHWKSVRTKESDPYRSAFKKTAEDIVKLLKKQSPERLERLQTIADLQFASAFAPEVFGEHLEVEDKRLKLISAPAAEDPMLSRTRALRVMDRVYLDNMQIHYENFIRTTNDSYAAWQEFSMESAKAAREAKSKAASQAILGGLLLLGAAYAASESNDDVGTSLAGTAAAVGGVVMLQKSFASSAEGKFHRDNLIELGQSLDIEIAPQVIKVEEEAIELQGGVEQQYRQWRAMLLRMYEFERIPNVQL